MRADQRVVGFAERVEDRPAGRWRAPRAARPRRVCTWPSIAPKVKIGPASPAATDPRRRRPGEEVAERGAHRAEQAGERQGREVERLRRADVRVRRDQVLLGLQDVGAALEQRRGQVGRESPGATSSSMRLAARDRPGIAAEQDRDQVLLRGDLLLERGDRRERLLVLRLDLLELDLRHHAALEAQLEDARACRRSSSAVARAISSCRSSARRPM